MRLTFAKETPEKIVEGVRRLARATRRALGPP
jgi:DNA-binding transcriptional MocR family regulator